MSSAACCAGRQRLSPPCSLRVTLAEPMLRWPDRQLPRKYPAKPHHALHGTRHAGCLVTNWCGYGLAVQALIQSFVRSTLTLTFVIAAARVVFNIKVGICQGAMGCAALCKLSVHCSQAVTQLQAGSFVIETSLRPAVPSAPCAGMSDQIWTLLPCTVLYEHVRSRIISCTVSDSSSLGTCSSSTCTKVAACPGTHQACMHRPASW